MGGAQAEEVMERLPLSPAVLVYRVMRFALALWEKL
jgi:hypothetical protein